MKFSSLSIALIFATAFLMASCNNSGSKEVKYIPANSGSTQQKPASDTTTAPANKTAQDALPDADVVYGPVRKDADKPAQAKKQTEETAPLLNPPHGQPGHDCSIPVGSPLKAQAQTKPVLNPPHGEPGHDCSVAVGAPLPN